MVFLTTLTQRNLFRRVLFEYWIHTHESRIFHRVLAQKNEFLGRESFDVTNANDFLYARRSHFDQRIIFRRQMQWISKKPSTSPWRAFMHTTFLLVGMLPPKRSKSTLERKNIKTEGVFKSFGRTQWNLSMDLDYNAIFQIFMFLNVNDPWANQDVRICKALESDT